VSYPPAPSEPAPPGEAAPVRRRRVALWVTAGALVVVVGAGTAVAVTSYFATPGPAQVVRSYFAALARDDARTALSYGPVPAGDRSYLTADVLRDQLDVGGISAVRAARVSAGEVAVHYEIGGRAVDDRVPVIHEHGRWRLRASAINNAVSLAAAGDRATFAGTALPDGSVLMFPGALPIRFDTAVLSVLPTAGIARFTPTADPAALAVQVSESGQQTVAHAVTSALTACVTSADPSPLCPVPAGAHVRAVPASLHGSLTQAPTVTTTVAPQPDGRLLITGSAAVDGSYQSLDYDNLPSEKRGQFDVVFSAYAYATAPGDFVWAPS